MKKFILLNLLLTTLVAGLSFHANAQYALQALGARFVVNAPVALQGSKVFTYSSNPAVTGNWGGALGSYFHVPLVKGLDSLASAPLTNAAAVQDKWVLIFRGGGFYFSDKAYNCWLAGAAGVIIVNNQPGADPINMAAATTNNHASLITIPVLMISNPDGLALNAALNAGMRDTISISPWGFNLNHDLSVVSGSNPVLYMGAMPYSQLAGANGTAQPYNIYSGGYAANIGTKIASNVVLASDITFTANGSTTAIRHDTVHIGNIATIDSLAGAYNNSVYHPAPTSTGRYDIKTYVYSDSTDQDSPDDTVAARMYVTDSIFCMGRWDAANSKPISTGSEGFASGNLTWGPLVYAKDGPYRIAQIQMGVNDNDTTKHDLTNNPGFFIYAMKWTDGSNQQPLDNMMQEGEDSVIGIGFKSFTSADSNDTKFTVHMNNNQNKDNTGCAMNANSWYYFAASTGTLLMNIDGHTNYFGRLYTSQHIGNKTTYFAPNTNDDPNLDFHNSPSTTLNNIPFFAIATVDSIGVGRIRSFDAFTPAFAVYTSKFHENAVANVSATKSAFVLYPNPAVGSNLHIKLDLASRSSVVYFEVVDGLGRVVYHDTRKNLLNEDIELPTSKLVPGRYFIAIKSDDALEGKSFIVLAN
jgi:hypothetical protein